MIVGQDTEVDVQIKSLIEEFKTELESSDDELLEEIANDLLEFKKHYPELIAIRITEQDENKMALLHYAAASGNLKAVHLILQIKNITTSFRELLPMQVAIRNKHARLYPYLIKSKHYNYIDAATGNGLLHEAILTNHFPSVEWLLLKGCNPFVINNNKESVIQLSRKSSDYNIRYLFQLLEPILEEIRLAGELPFQGYDTKDSVIIRPINNKRWDIFNRIIQEGLQHKEPLVQFVTKWNIEALQVTASKERNNQFLYYLIINNMTKVIKVLLQQKIDFRKSTALDPTTMALHPDFLELIARYYLGLYAAIYSRNINVVLLFVSDDDLILKYFHPARMPHDPVTTNKALMPSEYLTLLFQNAADYEIDTHQEIEKILLETKIRYEELLLIHAIATSPDNIHLFQPIFMPNSVEVNELLLETEIDEKTENESKRQRKIGSQIELFYYMEPYFTEEESRIISMTNSIIGIFGEAAFYHRKLHYYTNKYDNLFISEQSPDITRLNGTEKQKGKPITIEILWPNKPYWLSWQEKYQYSKTYPFHNTGLKPYDLKIIKSLPSKENKTRYYEVKSISQSTGNVYFTQSELIFLRKNNNNYRLIEVVNAGNYNMCFFKRKDLRSKLFEEPEDVVAVDFQFRIGNTQ